MENKERKYTYLLLFILLVAALLRFWAFWSIPFMHDELSAMSRLTFDHFSDLIKYGVVLNDTHPAGVQVLLYYWVMLVGEREIWVKLPFILSGVASVFLVYQVFRLWFDQTTGLLTAAVVASLQFFIMYSQIARPYVSGLFLTLIMVFYWSKFFFTIPKKRYLVLFSVFGALSSYNHHFSLLFAAIVGLSGVFFVTKKQLLPYTIAGLGIFALYIPHLAIFFYQADQGGIGGVGGWLDKPTPFFIVDFFSWLVHFSYFSGAMFVGVFAFLFSRKGTWINPKTPLKKRIVLILWFVLPLLIGYGYSIKVNPILQFSLLIFGTPYIIGFLFSFHKHIKIGQLVVLVILILAVNSVTLIIERDYYRIFYHQPYEEFFEIAVDEQSKQDVFLIDNSIPYMHGYYFRKFNAEIPYFTKRNKEFTISEFRKQVASIKQSTVVVQSLTGEEFQLVKSFFPYVLSYHHGFTYETYVLSKNSDRQVVGGVDSTIALYTKNKKQGNFKVKSELMISDSVCQKEQVIMTRETEWGFSLSMLLDSIIDDRFFNMDAQLYITPIGQVGSAVLTGYIMDGEEVIFWSASPFSRFQFKNGKNVSVFLTLDLQSILKSRSSFQDVHANFQVWNNHKEGHFMIDSMRVSMRKGNPDRYSLYYR